MLANHLGNLLQFLLALNKRKVVADECLVKSLQQWRPRRFVEALRAPGEFFFNLKFRKGDVGSQLQR